LRLLAELKQLQACLGDVHDTSQSGLLFQKLAHNVELSREIGYLAGWQARRGYEALLRFGVISKNFSSALKQWLHR